jgi:hypothetical protein
MGAVMAASSRQAAKKMLAYALLVGGAAFLPSYLATILYFGMFDPGRTEVLASCPVEPETFTRYLAGFGFFWVTSMLAAVLTVSIWKLPGRKGDTGHARGG